MGVTDNRSLEATTKHLTDRCTRIDIHRNGISICSDMWSSFRIGCPCVTTLRTSIDRVWCHVSTTIELSDNQWQTAFFIDVYCDGAIDATTNVITTKDTTEFTTGNRQRYITINGCILSTTKYLRDEFLWHTLQNDIYITIHWSLLSGTVDFFNLQFTSVGFVSIQ